MYNEFKKRRVQMHVVVLVLTKIIEKILIFVRPLHPDKLNQNIQAITSNYVKILQPKTKQVKQKKDMLKNKHKLKSHHRASK
jgi:hypothetical protein